MTTLKQKLADASAYLFPILVVGIWILGAFHGKKKHDIDPFSSHFFVCWYYGVETMWHKTDYAELNDNVKVATYLIMQKPETADASDQLEFNETKKKLKKVLSKLDSKELDYVKAGTGSFIEFIGSLQVDMINSFLAYKLTRKFDLRYSETTTKLAEKCKSYGLEKDMNDLKLEMEKMQNTFKSRMSDNSEPFDVNLINETTMKQDGIKKMNEVRLTEKEIFSNL